MAIIKVTSIRSNFEREPLIRPFGFKGGYLSELWQAISLLQTDQHVGMGLATQSVLYGDADLFARYSESGGNSLMYTVTQRALQILKDTPFNTPIDLIEQLIPQLIPYTQVITDKKDVSINFILNALISVDNAAWQLYARETGNTSFDAMLPEIYQPTLSARNKQIAIMFQVPYGMPISEIIEAVDQGYFVIKIKTGQPGTQQEMLEKDKNRLTEIFNALRHKTGNPLNNGKITYTLDSNGRYEKKETLQRLIDHAAKLGMLNEIQFIEEPLVEENEESVSGLGVRIAADERAHDEATTIKSLDLGYEAIILKGIAKSLSISLKIAKLAHDRNIPCACSDLTVNPALLEWHKNLAARLKPFPGIQMGLLETNGDMNYKNWIAMKNYIPKSGSTWSDVKNGVFTLDEAYYQSSGGIFEDIPHYRNLLQ